MGKHFGAIGFIDSQETSPGVWEEIVTEKRYQMDVSRNIRRIQNAESDIIRDIVLNNEVSIVMDSYLPLHFFAIRYVEWMGARWEVTTVQVQHPRLILQIGGVYNGPTPHPSG